jgi:hypothetical protein
MAVAKPQQGHKPGTSVPDSGIVKVPGKPEYATVVQGEKFPPTQKPGETWVYDKKTPDSKTGR